MTELRAIDHSLFGTVVLSFILVDPLLSSSSRFILLTITDFILNIGSVINSSMDSGLEHIFDAMLKGSDGEVMIISTKYKMIIIFIEIMTSNH